MSDTPPSHERHANRHVVDAPTGRVTVNRLETRPTMRGPCRMWLGVTLDGAGSPVAGQRPRSMARRKVRKRFRPRGKPGTHREHDDRTTAKRKQVLASSVGPRHFRNAGLGNLTVSGIVALTPNAPTPTPAERGHRLHRHHRPGHPGGRRHGGPRPGPCQRAALVPDVGHRASQPVVLVAITSASR